METLCGADCEKCEYGKGAGCKGCNATCGCPFGEQCFIYKYAKIGGKAAYSAFKSAIISEFNALDIDGMPLINKLYPLNGKLVNLAYLMPSGAEIKFLDDKQIYLGTQVECIFNDGETEKYFGLVAGMDFLMVSEYGKNCTNPQLVMFKRR